MEKKDVLLSLYSGGSFLVNFDNESEYNNYLKEKKKCQNLLIIILVMFLLGMISFVLSFSIHVNFIILSIVLLLVAVLGTKIYDELRKRYNYFKYDLIIKEIKKNKWRIEYSNDRTGHIKYSNKGEGHSIYVFKGKNTKSAR